MTLDNYKKSEETKISFEDLFGLRNRFIAYPVYLLILS